MALALADIVQCARARRFDPRLARITGRYRFEVVGAGIWRLHVEAGRVQVFDGPGDADCVVRCDADDFVRIFGGEQRLVTAFMQGRVDVLGDMVLAQALVGLAPHESAERRA